LPRSGFVQQSNQADGKKHRRLFGTLGCQKQTVPKETFIENNVIRNRERSLGIRDAVYIRRCRIGRGYGTPDVVFFPSRGPYRIAVVEAKQVASVDSKINVVGQLLMYYAGALQLGARGVRLMRRFATDHPRAATSLKPKSLKMLSGGLSPPDVAWKELCKGRSVKPDQVRLYVALNSEPGVALKGALSELSRHHNLNIGVVSVHKRDDLNVWHAA